MAVSVRNGAVSFLTRTITDLPNCINGDFWRLLIFFSAIIHFCNFFISCICFKTRERR